MLTAIICLILGGMIGIMATCLCAASSRADARIAPDGYCRNCGNAPGFTSTAACYQCEDYSQWIRKEHDGQS